MSWEYNDYTKPCPCGKGLIRVEDGSNDWGQTSHHETILCPECKQKADELITQKKERLRVSKNKISLVISYFKENYSSILEDKFINTKSKKAIWQVAYDLGIETQSLTTFYKHYQSKEKYIQGLISWYRIHSIILALEIDDLKLDDLYKDAKAHIKEFDDERATAAYMHYKGR